MKNIDPAIYSDCIAFRRKLHQIPEIGLEEYLTSAAIKEKLTSLGIPFREGYAGTGIVATIQGKKNGPSIGLRADFDALPIAEETGKEYQSKHPGKMHACGHDGHTAILLGTLCALRNNPSFDGKVHGIFQPGEEGYGGAAIMIKDGLFKDFPCDMIFALHNWPELPTGEIAVNSGAVMGGADMFNLSIRGKGGHAAHPNLCIDSIVLGSQLISAIQSIVSRNTDPMESCVISVCGFQAGNLIARNVIPETIKLCGTLRYLKSEVRDNALNNLKKVIDSFEKMSGAKIELEYDFLYPPTINHEKPAIFAQQAIKSYGGSLVKDLKPSLGAEDFSFMLAEVPGAYIRLGQKEPDFEHGLHTPKYDFNDKILAHGINLFQEVVSHASKSLS